MPTKNQTRASRAQQEGVTVNTISPGYIGTKMVTAIPKEILDTKIIPQIPVGRLGKPDEVAGLMQVNVQNWTSTGLPRSDAAASGSELSHPVAPASEGNSSSTGS